MRKQKNNKALLLIAAGFTTITALLILLLPGKLPHADCLQKSGVVSGIVSGGAKDMVVTLKDDSHTYYINRGFEAGSKPDAFIKRISGQKVVIYYTEPTTFSVFLATGKPSLSIRKLILKDTVVFSESGA